MQIIMTTESWDLFSKMVPRVFQGERPRPSLLLGIERAVRTNRDHILNFSSCEFDYDTLDELFRLMDEKLQFESNAEALVLCHIEQALHAYRGLAFPQSSR